MEKINLIDLFAGCGGIVDGFEASGHYTTLACVEWEKSPCTTLINRLHDKWGYEDAYRKVIRFDISRSAELLAGWKNDPEYGSNKGLNYLISDTRKNIDIVVGGPPCQSYSIAGRIRDENGMHNDYRNYLFEGYLKIVKEFQPKIVVFENVPGILSAKPGGISIIKRLTKGFNALNYDLANPIREFALLDLSDFGIPQKRSRVIIIALNRKYFKSCNKILKKFYKEYLCIHHTEKKSTVYDAIGDLRPFYPLSEKVRYKNRWFSHGPFEDTVPNHIPRFHNKRDIEIFKELAMDLENGLNKYNSIKALKELYTRKTGKVSNIHKYYVLRWNEPSNTIPAHLYKDGLRHIHPDAKQARSLTVREAARLQTFDDDFIFSGSMTDQYKMVGNAFPPLVSRILAESLYNFFEPYLKK